MVPRNPLQSVSCRMRLIFVPLRMVESELTYSIAPRRAGFADRPIVELNVNKAPIFTTLGVEGALSFLVMPMASVDTHTQKFNNSNALLTCTWNSISNKARKLLIDSSNQLTIISRN